MKIIHITPVFAPYASGMTNVVVEQTKELAKRGHSVTVITPRYKREWRKQETVEGVAVVRLTPWLRMGNGGFVPTVFFALMRLKPGAVVHVHAPFFGGSETVWLMKKLGLLRKQKLVVQYHHDPQLKGFTKLLSLPSKLTFSSLVRSADHVIVSSMDYAHASHIAQYINEKTVEIPFGVDTNRFAPLVKDAAWQERNDRSVNMLFVGALDLAHHFKGVEILIRALAMVQGNIHLDVVGKGDLVDAYKELAQKLGVSNRISFHGFVPDADLARYHQKADMFVFPSTGKAEAFGLVALEAMAVQLPVIASQLPGVRTLFGDDQLLVEPGNVEDLAAKITLLLNNSALRSTIGKHNYQRVLDHYTWPKVTNQLEKLYSL